jgi:hypothetical protein
VRCYAQTKAAQQQDKCLCFDCRFPGQQERKFRCRISWFIDPKKPTATAPEKGLVFMEFIGDASLLPTTSCIFPSARVAARNAVKHTRVTEVARASRRGESMDPRTHLSPEAVKAQREPTDGVAFLTNYIIDLQKDEVSSCIC